MKFTTCNAIAWIATSVAVIAAIYITKSPWCLWAFFIPAVGMTRGEKDNETNRNCKTY